jgi:copper ion binding protein
MKEITFPVTGMTCGNCAAHVEKALKGVEGVSNVQVDLEGGQATVHFSSEPVALGILAEAVSEAGYQVVRS